MSDNGLQLSRHEFQQFAVKFGFRRVENMEMSVIFIGNICMTQFPLLTLYC